MVRPVENIMQKEMTRKEFLATLGLGIASIMGVSQIVHMLSGKSLGHYLKSSAGYGSSAYGGGSEAVKSSSAGRQL